MFGTRYSHSASLSDKSCCIQIFRFSVWAGKPTPGSALLNLRYRDERHSLAQLKDLPSIIMHHEQAHSPHDLACANTQVLLWVHCCMTSSKQILLQTLSNITHWSTQLNGLNLYSDIFSLVLQVGGRSGIEGPGLSKWQRGLWGLGTVFMQYVWTRMDQVAAAQHWGDIDSTPAVQRAWSMMRSCETALNMASLLNFLVFLRQGKYRQARLNKSSSHLRHKAFALRAKSLCYAAAWQAE